MNFQKAYAKLNPDQKLAVDTIDGPVMVVAGPGTGKTQILASRIANILQKTDVHPSSILALTFTESAAKNMQQRLITLIGSAAYSVHIQTFHSFCDSVIQECPEYFPIERESSVLSDLERFELMEGILKQPRWEVLRTINSPFHYLKPLLRTISDLKKEGISSAKLIELVGIEKDTFEEEKGELKKGELVKQAKRLAKMAELSEVYVLYQQALKDKARYDYDDMIAFVADAFEHQEELLLQYQEKLLYFLIDEYQDTNASQNKVVDLLASYWGDQANIFVVGDPNQSIYRFQGASLENTLNFLDRYPAVQVIQLKTGYRCTSVVYQAAAQIIQAEKQDKDTSSARGEDSGKLKEVLAQLELPLTSVQDTASQIQIIPLANAQLETVYITNSIEGLIKSGIAPREIAVLYRNNADAVDLERALQKWQIPYSIDAGHDALKNPSLLQLFNLFDVIQKLHFAQEGYELFELLNYAWIQMNPLTIMAVSRAAGKTNMSIYERVKLGFPELVKLPFCDEVSALDFSVLEDFISQLEAWGKLDAEMTFPSWFEKVMNESGFLSWVLAQSNATETIQYLNALFREANSLSLQYPDLHLAAFLRSIQVMQNHGIQLVVDEYSPNVDAVTLSTVHKAKGQEWAYVFIAQCIDGKWGNSRSPSELPLPDGILQHQASSRQDRNEDDERLFYVAVTRAKTQVMISYPESVMSSNRSKLTLPTQFIEKIDRSLREEVSQHMDAKNQEKSLARLLEQIPSRAHDRIEREWLQKVISDFHLSATALNTYLRSPVDFLEDVLLKVPRAREPYQAFGTAVHFALEQLYKSVQSQQKLPDMQYFLTHFEKGLQKEILSTEEFQLRFAYGKKMLHDYYLHVADEEVKPLFVEKMFGYGWNATMLGDIPLNGRIDRIDWLDQSLKTVKVIDYKTGRARSLNDIEGKVGTEEYSERELALPENIRGRLKRQLLFYKLLTQLDQNFPATVIEGVFDFVEPDRDGKFTQRQVPLLEEDVAALKDLIIQVMQEIRTLQFLG